MLLWEHWLVSMFVLFCDWVRNRHFNIFLRKQRCGTKRYAFPWSSNAMHLYHAYGMWGRRVRGVLPVLLALTKHTSLLCRRHDKRRVVLISLVQQTNENDHVPHQRSNSSLWTTHSLLSCWIYSPGKRSPSNISPMTHASPSSNTICNKSDCTHPHHFPILPKWPKQKSNAFTHI